MIRFLVYVLQQKFIWLKRKKTLSLKMDKTKIPNGNMKCDAIFSIAVSEISSMLSRTWFLSWVMENSSMMRNDILIKIFHGNFYFIFHSSLCKELQCR